MRIKIANLRHVISPSVVCIALFAASNANAGMLFEDASTGAFVSDNGMLYGSVAVGAVLFEAPERDHVGGIYEEDDNVQLNNVYRFEPDDTAPAIGFTLGSKTPGIDLFGGANTRLEVSLQYFNAEDSSRTVRDNSASGYYTDFLGIDGSGYINDCCNGSTIVGSFQADYDVVDLDVRLRSDIKGNDKNLTWIPSLGFAVTKLNEDYQIRFRDMTGGVDFNSIDESVDTTYLGPVVGLAFNYKSSSKWTFHGGASLHLALADSDYEGSQTDSPVSLVDRTASDKEDTISYNTTLSIGAAYDAGWSMVSFVAGVQYWSYAPVVEHPVAPLGVGYNSISATEPAHISSDSMTTGFVGVRLTSSF